MQAFMKYFAGPSTDPQPPSDMTDTTVFQARQILTMNPARPRATHVAVRDGRILGAGSIE